MDFFNKKIIVLSIIIMSISSIFSISYYFIGENIKKIPTIKYNTILSYIERELYNNFDFLSFAVQHHSENLDSSLCTLNVFEKLLIVKDSNKLDTIIDCKNKQEIHLEKIHVNLSEVNSNISLINYGTQLLFKFYNKEHDTHYIFYKIFDAHSISEYANDIIIKPIYNNKSLFLSIPIQNISVLPNNELNSFILKSKYSLTLTLYDTSSNVELASFIIVITLNHIRIINITFFILYVTLLSTAIISYMSLKNKLLYYDTHIKILRNAVEIANIGFTITDKESNIIYVNTYDARIHGYTSKDELIGKRSNIYSPATNNHIKMRIDNNVEYENWKRLSKNIRKNGEIFPVELISNPIIIDGKFEGRVNICKDISKELKIEEENYKYRTLLETIINTIPDQVYAKNSELQFILVNNAIISSHNVFTKDEILGKTDHDLFTKDHADMFKHDEMTILETGFPIINKEEHVFNTHTKDTQWFLTTKVLMKDKSGKSIGIIGVNRDITERKKFEEFIIKEEKRYKALYKMVRNMCDNVPDMIWAKDLQKNFIFANKAICEQLLITHSINEPIGKNDIFFANRQRQLFPEKKDWHTFGELCQDSDIITLKENKPMRFGEYGNVKGKFMYLDVYKAPFINENNEVIGTVGSARIITKEIINRKKLQKAYTELGILYEASKIINSSMTVDDILTKLVNLIPRLLNSDTGVILFLNKNKTKLHIRKTVGLSDNVVKNTKDNIGESIAGRVVQYKKPIIVNDLLNSNIFENEVLDEYIYSCISVPLFIDNQIIGTMDSHHKIKGKKFTSKDLKLLTLLQNQVSVALKKVKLYNELNDLKETYKVLAENSTQFLKAINDGKEK